MNIFLSDELPGTDFHHYAAFLGRKKIVRILIPSGIPPQSGWRVCYLLHPFGGNRLSWLRYLDISPFKRGCDLLLVFPESGRRWFINDASGNRYEDYIIEDLVPAIDAAFPTDQRAESRMIGGFSMGGATAVYLVLRHP